MLSQGSHSKSVMAKKLGLKSVTGAFNRTVKKMLNEGLIEYTIPDKPNSRLQTYRLTARGRIRFHYKAEADK